MFPGLGKMNPKQMQGLLKQFGIKNEELNAKRVVIELADGNKIAIENPNVSLMLVQGQKIYSVMGGEQKEEKGTTAETELPEEDIELVMQKADCSREEAKKALEKSNGDIAEAIVRLKK